MLKQAVLSLYQEAHGECLQICSSRDHTSRFTFLLSLRKQLIKNIILELDLNQKNRNNKNQQLLPKTEDRTVKWKVGSSEGWSLYTYCVSVLVEIISGNKKVSNKWFAR
ncbi:unnamed protein product (mitochondrion) [Musa textilis]